MTQQPKESLQLAQVKGQKLPLMYRYMLHAMSAGSFLCRENMAQWHLLVGLVGQEQTCVLEKVQPGECCRIKGMQFTSRPCLCCKCFDWPDLQALCLLSNTAPSSLCG